jgi:archaellum component FlaC
MSIITEDRIQRLEGRVTAVEQAQNDNTQSLRFIVATVAQMKAVQDDHSHVLEDHTRILGDHTRILGDHTRKLDDHSQRLGRIENDLGSLRTEVHALRKELPTIVADVMREVLREKR